MENANLPDSTYAEIVEHLNEVLAEDNWTVEKLKTLITTAKEKRQNSDLQSYLLELKEQFLADKDLEQIKKSEEFRPLLNKLSRLLLMERVINPLEELLLRRFLYTL